jgi:hypothetical protein
MILERRSPRRWEARWERRHPREKALAKKVTVGKKGKAGANKSVEEVGKMIGKVNSLEEKQKIPKENGINVMGDKMGLASEELMQEKFANLARK